VAQIVRSAQTNTLISKLITSIFIAVFGFAIFLPLTMDLPSFTTSKELTLVGGVSAFLAVVLFLIMFMGLQVSTSFVSAKVVDVLSPLPLSKHDISNVVFLCFVRIFDIPLISAVVVFIATYFSVGGSILGGLISLVGIGIAEIFALTLTIGSAKFFYSRVSSAGGRSKWQTLSRFGFMLVWILPTFAAYFVVSFAQSMVQFLASMTESLSSVLPIVVLIYPFSYGFLVSYATFFGGMEPFILIFSIAASVAYAAAAYYCLRWVTQTIRRIGTGTIATRVREVVKDTVIKPQNPWFGIIRKDLRVASRAPSYASLFLLPAMQTAILAVTFSSVDTGLSSALGILTGISMITLLLPTTLLSIEGLASAYTRSLPMNKRTLISAKTLLTTITYMISLGVLLVVATVFRKDFSSILTFGAIHTFSVSAAVMLELTILANRFWKEGFAVGNIYARLFTYILILIPGFAVVLVPIVAALATFFFAQQMITTVFLVVALAEFAVMATIVARTK